MALYRDTKSGARVDENYSKRLKLYGLVVRMKEEHIVRRRMLDVHIPGKRIGLPNKRWEDNRDLTEAGLKEDNTITRAAWINQIVSYAGDSR